MRFVLALLGALALVACNTPPGPGPTPSAPSVSTAPPSPPPPTAGDAGDACAQACTAASALCDRVATSPSDCAHRCAMGLAQLSGASATARCLAAELTCGSKEWCTK